MIEPILWPVIALVGWTLIVLTCIPIARFRSSGRKEVNAGDFRYGESERVPPRVSLPNRNYMNLTEAPVLFYVVCIVAYLLSLQTAFWSGLAIGSYSMVFLGLAWAYVASRVIHSLVHLTYNNVIHRLAAFAVSNVILLTMWVMLALRMLNFDAGADA